MPSTTMRDQKPGDPESKFSLRLNQAQAGASRRIDRNHRVHEDAVSLALLHQAHPHPAESPRPPRRHRVASSDRLQTKLVVLDQWVVVFESRKFRLTGCGKRRRAGSRTPWRGGRHELALSYVARYGFVDRTRWVLARC